jgi:hypothetical protein
MCPDNCLINPKTCKPDKIIEILQSLVMKVFLEIESGKGRWSQIQDLGAYTSAMQKVWMAIKFDAFASLNNIDANSAYSISDQAISTMKTDPNISVVLTPGEYQAFELALKYLVSVRDACKLNENCTVRVYQSNYPV